MPWILSLFLISLAVYSLFKFLHSRSLSAMKKMLEKHFPDSLVLESGSSFCSISRLHGENGENTISCSKASANLYLHRLFKNTTEPILEIDINNLELLMPKIASKIEMKSQKELSLETWIGQKMVLFLCVFFVRTIRLKFTNIRISINGGTFILNGLDLLLIRDKKTFSIHLQLKDIQVIYKAPLLHLPAFSLSIEGTANVIRIFLEHRFNLFKATMPSISLHYSEGHLKMLPISMHIGVDTGEEVKCDLIISSIDLYVSLADVYTKFFSISVFDIAYNKGNANFGRISITRNNIPLLSTNRVSYKKGTVSTPHINIDVPFALIIDYALLMRYFTGNAELKNPSQMSSIKQIRVESDSVNCKLFLSDHHVLKFIVDKAVYQGMELSANRATCDVYFQNNAYRFLEGKQIVFGFEKPNFNIKGYSLKLFFDCNFPGNTFLQELFGLFAWIERQFRGKAAVGPERDQEPPTRRRFTIEATKASFEMHDRTLSNVIAHSNEAKRAAMEALLLRQYKAVQIIGASKSWQFNDKEFDQASRKMLFNFFKDALNNMPKMEKSIYAVKGTNAFFELNGPAVPNKEAAIEKLLQCEPDLDVNTVGKISGGLITASASTVYCNIKNVKNVVTQEKFAGSGFMFVARAKGVNRNDFFHFRISMDNGMYQSDIPIIASKPVTFVKVEANADKGLLKMTPVELESFQNMKLATTFYRKSMVFHKNIAFVDKCRLGFRPKLALFMNDYRLQYSDVTQAYDDNGFIDCYFPNCDVTFDGTKFHLLADSLVVRVKSHLGYQRIGIFPNIEAITALPCSNPKNPSGKRPVFIPIDTTRMQDPDYDPYEFYRTIHFHTYVNAVFNTTKIASIDLDLLQTVLDQFIFPRSVHSVYRRPGKFAKRFEPTPWYDYTHVEVLIPPLSFSMLRNTLNIKISGQPIKLLVTNQNEVTVKVNAPYLEIPAFYNARSLFQLNIKDLLVNLHGKNTDISSDSLDGFISTSLLSCLTLIKLNFPKKVSNKVLPETLRNIRDLTDYFTIPAIAFILTSLNVRLDFPDDRSVKIQGNHLSYDVTKDGNRESSLNTIALKSLTIFTHDDYPLLKVDRTDVYLAAASNILLCFANCPSISGSLRPNDIELFKLLMEEIKSIGFEKPVKEDQPISSRAIIVSGEISKLGLSLIVEDEVLISCTINQICGDLNRKPDASEIITAGIRSIFIKQDQALDAFQILMETIEEPFFKLYIQKARKIMKCPVFDSIEAKITPFVIRIPMLLIRNLVTIFPSAESLRMLEQDINELDDENQLPPPLIEEELPPSENTLETTEPTNAIFCREFVIHPFNVEMNIRRKASGAFKEFLNRPFNYKGLQFFDIVGTKDELAEFVKKNLKRTVIRAIPSLVFKRKKKMTHSTSNQENLGNSS